MTLTSDGRVALTCLAWEMSTVRLAAAEEITEEGDGGNKNMVYQITAKGCTVTNNSGVSRSRQPHVRNPLLRTTEPTQLCQLFQFNHVPDVCSHSRDGLGWASWVTLSNCWQEFQP